MTTYVDSSALLKRYVEEADSERADEFLRSDAVLVTSWITTVEVRRNLARLVTPTEMVAMRRQLNADLDAMALVAADQVVCEAAAEIAEHLGVRSLDAVHLASGQRLGVADLVFLTFDLRQAQAARTLGFRVLGA